MINIHAYEINRIKRAYEHLVDSNFSWEDGKGFVCKHPGDLSPDQIQAVITSAYIVQLDEDESDRLVLFYDDVSPGWYAKTIVKIGP